MSKRIKSAVRKYIKGAKGTDFISAKKYIEKLGYNVILYNTPCGDEKLIQYNCVDIAKNHRAFTQCGVPKTIFINNNASLEDKRYLLLHEIGHILLGHIGDGYGYARNSILIDIEANAFVNALLEYKEINYLPILCVVMILTAGIVVNIAFRHDNSTPTYTVPTNTVDTDMSDNQTDIVYITRTGTKYHRADCRYTKDKDCIAVSKSEAEQNHTPCKICKP